MTSGGAQEYKVSVSEDFWEQLRQRHSAKDAAPPAAATMHPPNFAIRYSTTPELLKRNNCDLTLRKTTRGEYLIEDDQSAPGRELGTGQEEGTIPASASASAKYASGPSFRGPATGGSDGECMLIFNEETQAYELHPLNINFQFAPVLKSRPRANPPASRETSPVKQPLKPTTTTTTSAAKQQLAKQTKQAKQPLEKLAAPPPNEPRQHSPAKNSTSAAFIPKTTTRARLPTRRKVPAAKPKPKQDSASPPPSPINSSFSAAYSSTASTPRLDPQQPVPPSHASSAAKPASRQTSETPSSPQPTPSSFDAGIDDAFNDLADELADELMEDEEDVHVSRSVGTAGGSADDEDVSSEEE